MKKVIASFVLLLASVALLYATGRGKNSMFKTSPTATATATVKPTAKIGSHSFSLNLARTESEKQIGLSDKTNIKDNEGMLFLFTMPSYYSFWMKNMKFPIDIIYISGNKIVDIYPSLLPPKENEEPTVVTPKAPADKVLEIMANLSKKYNFQKGDFVLLKY